MICEGCPADAGLDELESIVAARPRLVTVKGWIGSIRALLGITSEFIDCPGPSSDECPAYTTMKNSAGDGCSEATQGIRRNI